MKLSLKKIAQKQINSKLLLFFIFLIYLFLAMIVYFNNKILPRIEISGIDMGGKTVSEAQSILQTKYSQRVSSPLSLNYSNQNFTIDLKKTDPQVNIYQSLQEANLLGHSENFFKNIHDGILVLLFGKKISPGLSFGNNYALILQINQINLGLKKKPTPAKIILGEEISIIPSENGLELDQILFLAQIKNYLNLSEDAPTTLPIKVSLPKFTTERAESYKILLENIKDKPLILNFEDKNIAINSATLLSLMDTEEGKEIISLEKLTKFLEDLSLQINRPVQDPKFIFDPASKRVREFQPALSGQELDIAQTANFISQTIATSSGTISLPVKITQPKNSTSDSNSYGITDILGEGLSNFAGSIENRIYNIKLASSRINGVLIAPGAIFSFNKTVGDISAASGYKQAYIIKEGRTILDDGGGVCQVSTTLFRAVLNSGLPVVKRTAHAYRVGYYEQGFPPGLDATVFAPGVDFKFKNDTGSYVLMQAYTSGLSLYVDLYGAPDGRTVTLTKPTVADQTPPPPELRQDDPTLPKGTVKQVDWPAWGANVTFYRTVKRGDEILISEKWFSAFKPWQAVYLVGTRE